MSLCKVGNWSLFYQLFLVSGVVLVVFQDPCEHVLGRDLFIFLRLLCCAIVNTFATLNGIARVYIYTLIYNSNCFTMYLVSTTHMNNVEPVEASGAQSLVQVLFVRSTLHMAVPTEKTFTLFLVIFFLSYFLGC